MRRIVYQCNGSNTKLFLFRSLFLAVALFLFHSLYRNMRYSAYNSIHGDYTNTLQNTKCLQIISKWIASSHKYKRKYHILNQARHYAPCIEHTRALNQTREQMNEHIGIDTCEQAESMKKNTRQCADFCVQWQNVLHTHT